MAIIIIFFTHLLIFLSYPETTPLGPSYMFISIIISSIFYYLIRPLIIKQTENISFTIKLIMWLILLFITLINYPQKDSRAVLLKIYYGELPNRLTIYRGFKKIGIDAYFLLTLDKK